MGIAIRFRIRNYWGIIILAFFLYPVHLNAATIYVDASAAGANNGSSWTDAFTSLSDALSIAVSGDKIWVARGVYKPDTPVDFNSSGGNDPREYTFQIPDGVKLYGGFAGTEINLNQRNFNKNLTILSGDIDNNDLNPDSNFIAEDVSDLVGRNSYHVVYTENVSCETELNGFIITAGNANIASPVNVFDPNLDGGGWYNRLSGIINASSPTIVNTKFIGNFASSEGGALFNEGTSGGEIISLIKNCEFINNKSDITGGAIYLGSFSPGDYKPHILNCKFINNEAFRRGGALYLLGDSTKVESSVFNGNKVTAVSLDFSTLPGSGGAANLVTSNAVFTNCLFSMNTATGNPTGPFEGGGGGAVYASTNDPQTASLGASEPKFISCGFYSNSAGGNTAAWGGAAAHLSDAGILRPVYINCVFAGNQAQDHGGAIANFTRVISEPESFTPALEPEFTNCTFTGNHADERGGALYNDGFLFMGSEILVSRLENCILWNNTASVDGPEVYNTGNNNVLYSLVMNSGGSGGGWDNSIGTDLGNNIDADPLFVNESDPLGADAIPANSDDGLMFSAGSPALNSGNNSAPGLAGISSDYTGNTRIQNGFVDMGAYEYGPDGSSAVTGVEDADNIPGKFFLAQNYPNPFNPSTTIEFSLPEAGRVNLSVYNILGEVVATLVNETKEAGNYIFNFNASGLSSGLYLYRLEFNHIKMENKMLLQK
ncbi:MAG: T9SS type A sorting domain-containing protein [Ignavibacteriaceae bacterium]